MLAPLANRFLPAFLATLDELADLNYFADRAGDECVRCGQPYFWTATLVKRALTAEVGPVNWPLLAGEAMPDDRVIVYVEAFYQIVARPRNIRGTGRHAAASACGISHADSFDVPGGRYDYTCRVNSLLTRFATELRLEKGVVRSAGSPVMSPRLLDELPYGGDDHLRTLVAKAIEDYRSAHIQNRWSAVVHLANAVERVKTMLDPADKARSATMLVAVMSPEPTLNSAFDSMLRAITEVSNKATVRHHEVGKAEIFDDGDMIDFLFYQYYNVLRLALLRLDAQGRRGQATAAAS
jgi:hypothetical protein